ncbi:MAG: hypothetical protein PHW60_12315 [Kiritimatiellae bacterium]|nr:hypothetical protein [Kiritimatiellia bacterium]
METKGLVVRQRHASAGNACLLVVVDSQSSFWNYTIVDQTVLCALEHCGMPYRVLDLAQSRLTEKALRECACLVLAQSQLGSSLTPQAACLIAAAVKSGMGLVNLDNDLRLYPDAYLEIFGFERVNPHMGVTSVVHIRPADHYISALQKPGTFHDLDRMATFTIVERWRPDVMALADGVLGKDQLVYIRHLTPGSSFIPGTYPILFAGRWGRGKAVQFAISPRVWRQAIYGHGRNLDDLFWRALVWAARKPFAANLIPPFVTMSVDDCSGAHNFGYVDIAHRHGYVPMPSLFLKNVPPRLYPMIRDHLKRGITQFNTHAMDYYDLMIFKFGQGELSDVELKRHFEYESSWWRKVGARPGPTLRFHWTEYGVRALPFLKRTGRLFFNPALQTGLMKADHCIQDGFWPYNLQTRYYDYLPDDHDFYGFASVHGRYQEDFLAGNTVYDNQVNDVEKAAETAADHIAAGLRCGFYGECITHEQRIAVLSLEEWEKLLARVGQRLEKFEKIFTGYDQIGQYLRARDGVWLGRSAVRDHRLQWTLSGQSSMPMQVSIFQDEGETVLREFKSVSA